MSGTVRTVTGDVDAASLGITNAHEHVLIRNGLIVVQQPDFKLDSNEKAIEELREYHTYGGGTVVDTGPLSIGRDPNGLLEISEKSGVKIIATTGFHKTKYYLDTHWRFRYSAEQIAKLLIEEIEIGMEQHSYEGPIIERSKAKAGCIKVASDYQKIDGPTRIAIEAAGAAHLTTGAPVLTHTEMGTQAAEQVELLGKFGVEPAHIVLSHMDRNPDLYLHKELANAGAFLEYDGPGRVKYFPESTLIALMRGMIDAGCGGQILLGGDTARRSYWKSYGGGPGLAYIVEHFVPRMKKEGFSQTDIDNILIHNPARVFAMKGTAKNA